MTRKQVEQANRERKELGEQIRQSQKFHEKAIAAAAEGTSVIVRPAGKIERVEVEADAGGCTILVEVYDASFGEETKRFAGPEAGMQARTWVALMQTAWRHDREEENRFARICKGVDRITQVLEGMRELAEGSNAMDAVIVDAIKALARIKTA